MTDNEPTDDELFEQIARNMNAMLAVIQSQGAEINRLKFRVQRLESAKEP